VTVTGSLERLFGWILVLSLACLAVAYFLKDRLPDPDGYDLDQLVEPRQRPTRSRPFTTEVNGEDYVIEPKFEYELNGVIVSYHDADSFSDIWHHDRWRDFLNLRDLCVIWGENVASGVYLDMSFRNDSWTCWFSWPDAATGRRFDAQEISNNHLLADSDEVKQALMSAEPGDHIWLKGVLASYRNSSNRFFRGTSVTRSDTGNGACETIYVDELRVVAKANPRMRKLYEIAKWSALVSLIGFVIMFALAPVRRSRYA